MLLQIVLTALTATALAPCVLQRACPTRAPRPPSSVCMHRFEGQPYATLLVPPAAMLAHVVVTLLAALMLAPCVVQRACASKPPHQPTSVCMHRFKKTKFALKNLRIGTRRILTPQLKN